MRSYKIIASDLDGTLLNAKSQVSKENLRAIETLAARGVLAGYEDGSFRPGAPVTRGQMAKILYVLQ